MNKSEHPLLESFTCHGFWWLPGESEPVSGVLTYTPEDSIVLEVVILGRPHDFDAIGPIAGLIQGVTSDNRFFYLTDLILVKNSHALMLTPSKTSRTYQAAYLIESGRPLPLENENPDFLLSSVMMGFDHLSTWMDLHPITNSVDEGGGYSQLLQRPKPVTHIVDEQKTRVSFSTVSSADIDVSNPYAMSGGLFLRPVIEVVPHSGQNLKWYIAYFRKLQHLIIVLMGYATNINHVAGTFKVSKKEDGPPITVLIYWAQDINVKRTREVRRETMLVPFTEFKSRKQKISKWIANYETIKDQIALFIETILNPGMYPEFRWLATTQAIESYHRKVFGGAFVKKEAYQKDISPLVKSAIPPSLAQDHRQSLKSKIDFGYEYSLNRRLRDFLNKLPDDLVKKLLTSVNCDKPKDFTYAVKETRNYYTHYDEGIFILDEDEQREYGMVLRKLMFAHLLKQIGFTDNELKSAFLTYKKRKKVSKKKSLKRKTSKKKTSKSKKKVSKKKSVKRKTSNRKVKKAVFKKKLSKKTSK